MKDIGDATGMLTDCGGGSTEISLFTGDEIIFADTMPIGSLNAYHRHVDGISPIKKLICKLTCGSDSASNRIYMPR